MTEQLEMFPTQVCWDCKKELPLHEFHKDKRSKNGHGSQCKSCKQKYQIETWHVHRFNMNTSRQKRGKVPFVPEEERVTADQILQMYNDVDGKCPCCGTYMDPAVTDYAPSVDRIKNYVGYSFLNVWVICNACNKRKNDAISPHDLYIIADAWHEKLKEVNLQT